jgi:hypothetical protein
MKMGETAVVDVRTESDLGRHLLLRSVHIVYRLSLSLIRKRTGGEYRSEFVADAGWKEQRHAHVHVGQRGDLGRLEVVARLVDGGAGS